MRVLHVRAEFNNARALSRDRFSVTPTAIYDELVRNAQKLQSLWNEDATWRQARMSSPLDEEEQEVVETQNNDEQAGAAVNASETVPRVPDKHLDIDSEFRSGKGKFKNWHDVVKIANEVHLDEMKALLETGPQFFLMRSIEVASFLCVAWRRRCV